MPFMDRFVPDWRDVGPNALRQRFSDMTPEEKRGWDVLPPVYSDPLQQSSYRGANRHDQSLPTDGTAFAVSPSQPNTPDWWPQ